MDPVFAKQPDLRFEDGKVSIWFTEPPGAIVQLTEAATFTKDMAEWVVGPSFSALLERHPAGTKLHMLLDIRPLTAREPAARPLIMGTVTKNMFTFAQLGVIAPKRPPPLYMNTLRGAIALLSAIGPKIYLFDSIEEALQTMGLSATP